MTLDSRIMLLDDGISPMAAFQTMAALLDAPASYVYKEEQGDPESGDEWKRKSSIAASPGQGLGAWLMVYHWNGELTPAHVHDKWCYVWEEDGHTDELECDKDEKPDPRGYVEISIDTTYGYHEPNGAGCGDLHAYLISEFGKWAESCGVRWVWYDESGDGWQPEGTSLLKLGDAEAGKPGSTKRPSKRDERMLWFHNAVLPAIQAEFGNVRE